MNISNNQRGMIFALMATIAYSSVYVFSKIAMQNVSLAAFGTLWFAFASLWCIIYSISQKQLTFLYSLDKKQLLILLSIAFSELIATVAFFAAIKLNSNPAMVSFIANTSPIFVVVLAFFIIKERFNKYEIFGIITGLIGIIILGNADNTQEANFWNFANILTLVFAMFYALSIILAKKYIKQVPASAIVICRSLMLLLFFSIYLICTKEVPVFDLKSTVCIIVGSFLGPFLATILSYFALKHTSASMSMMIISTRSFFIIIGSFLFMNILPTSMQLIGGSFTVLGIIIMAFAKKI